MFGGVMDHAVYLKRALELAQNGWPAALPNPLVGCVIVKDGQIVAEAAHLIYGGPHAEVNAIAALPSDVDPRQCTVYVTLEPCSHFGKTPPCADLLISRGFQRVIVAVKDPNPLVSGKGIALLEQAGIQVVSGIAEEEARQLNRRFFTFHEQQRPYIVLKWAQSQDGFVSRFPVPANRSQNMISREAAQVLSHELRAQSQAILVGKNTVLADNPSLTLRLAKGRQALRVVLDRHLEIPKQMSVFSEEAPVLIVNEEKSVQEGHLTYLKIKSGASFLKDLLGELHKRGIQNLLVEGGTRILQVFLDEGLWDEVVVVENPDLRLGSGISAPIFAMKNSFRLVGGDKVFHHYKNETLPASGALSREIF